MPGVISNCFLFQGSEKERRKEESRDKDEKKDKDKDKKKKEKVVTTDPLLLLAFVYFDQTHCGYILDKDLEELLYALGLNLSRAQVTFSPLSFSFKSWVFYLVRSTLVQTFITLNQRLHRLS